VLRSLLEAQRVPGRPRIVLAAFCGLLAGMVTVQKNMREPTPRHASVRLSDRRCMPGAGAVV